MTIAAILELADNALLAVGALGIMAAIAMVSIRKQWGGLLQLSARTHGRLETADVLLAVFSFFFLPALCLQAFLAWRGGPTSMPASSQSGVGLPQHTLAATASLTVASCVMLRIGLARFGGTAGWGLTSTNLWRRLGQAIVGYILVTPICFVLLVAATWILDAIGSPAEKHSAIVAIIDPSTPEWIRYLTIFNALVLSAVTEELFFRGILQPAISVWLGQSWGAVILCGFLFGAIHYPYVDTIMPLAAFGVVLGYLYAKTGSLTLVVLLHAVFNGKTLLWLMLGAKP